MRALIFVYIIEEVTHAHAQTAPHEWFLSIPGLEVMPRLLSEIGILFVSTYTTGYLYFKVVRKGLCVFHVLSSSGINVTR